MIEFYNDIMKTFEHNSDILFGISNIDFSEYNAHYKCALVFAVPHKELLSINNYKEEKFENIICESRDCINLILEKLSTIFDKYKIQYYIPPVSQSSEETLIAPFSFKFAAANAGLGWIGKNDILITEKYGPRVRLSAILIDYNLPVGKPVKNSKCPPNCNICVSSCPYNALTGHSWDISSHRQELINYKLCNQKRSLFLKKYDRKNSCGLCMVSCPIGLPQGKNIC